MHILWLKLFYVVAIFVAGVIGGRAPGRGTTTEGSTMALGSAFSGGVFLGAGLLHLLPDSASNFSKFADDIDFPLAPLVTGIGFLLILLFDQVSKSGEVTTSTSSDQAAGHPFLLFFILSIHSIIAGAALGLEGASTASTAIFIAIIAHKGSAGFALGVALVKGRVEAARRQQTILMFAAMTPLGVVLGTFLATAFTGTTDIIFEAYFDALAAGTFLYITTFDILPKAMEESISPWLQWFMVAAGFGLMVLVAVWA